MTDSNKESKFLVSVLKNTFHLFITTVVASVLLVIGVGYYAIFLMLTLLILMSFTILWDLSQSTKLYNNYFKDISANQLMISILIYIGGVAGPGILYLIYTLSQYV